MGGVPADKQLEYDDMDKFFPKVLFFPKNKGEPKAYDGTVTSDGLKAFFKKEAKVYFGLAGCLKELDDLAAGFKASPKETLAKAEKLAKTYADAEADKAAYYLKVMEKAVAKGADYLSTEKTRLSKLLDGPLSDEKKAQFQKRMNVLGSFEL